MPVLPPRTSNPELGQGPRPRWAPTYGDTLGICLRATPGVWSPRSSTAPCTPTTRPCASSARPSSSTPPAATSSASGASSRRPSEWTSWARCSRPSPSTHTSWTYDRVRHVDLPQVNRVLRQPHWRRDQDPFW